MIQQVPLSEACEFVLDGTHSSPVRCETGIPVLSAQNVSDGLLNYNTERFTTQAEFDSFRRRLDIRVNDVLLTIVGSIGRTAVVGEIRPLVFQRSVAVLRPRAGVLDSRFLFHSIQFAAFQRQLQRATNQSSQAGVYLGKLKKITIPLPSIEEQRWIAAILDRAEALRTKRRAVLAQLDTLTRSIFLDLFGNENSAKWPLVTVADVAGPADGSIRTGPFGSQLLHSEFVDEGVAVLGIDNVVENKFRWAKPRFITERKYQDLKRYTVHPGDVLITIMGTCGRCAIVPDDVPRAINTKHLCCITLDPKKCLPAFLHAYFLRHPIARRYLDQTAKGAIMAGLNMAIIKELPIRLAPLQLQTEFVRLSESVTGLRSTQNASLDQLELLFASVQNRAFAGEI